MSADLIWQLTRNNSSFLVKSMGLTLTKEPNNLSGRNTFKYNGLANKKVVSVEPAESGKGVVVSLKKTKGHHKPGKAYRKTTISRGGRHTVKVISDALEKGHYRRDLQDMAVRRASAILRSQNAPAVVKKKRTRRKAN